MGTNPSETFVLPHQSSLRLLKGPIERMFAGESSRIHVDPAEVGVVVVDHGSRRGESNAMLEEVVALFIEQTRYAIVEPAHMELAEPSLETAFRRCVERGARLVVVHPYFLLPGRHSNADIPQLAAAAAAQHPGVKVLVTAPLGLHRLMTQIMDERIRQCLADADS